MAEKRAIALGTIIDRFHLEVLYGPDNYRDRKISIEHVDRPGLQLTGYFDYFDRERIQLIGRDVLLEGAVGRGAGAAL